MYKRQVSGGRVRGRFVDPRDPSATVPPSVMVMGSILDSDVIACSTVVSASNLPVASGTGYTANRLVCEGRAIEDDTSSPAWAAADSDIRIIIRSFDDIDSDSDTIQITFDTISAPEGRPIQVQTCLLYTSPSPRD